MLLQQNWGRRSTIARSSTRYNVTNYRALEPGTPLPITGALEEPGKLHFLFFFQFNVNLAQRNTCLAAECLTQVKESRADVTHNACQREGRGWGGGAWGNRYIYRSHSQEKWVLQVLYIESESPRQKRGSALPGTGHARARLRQGTVYHSQTRVEPDQ